MDKELKNLLDNYEKVIYGQAFPIDPSMYQLHLLLDYIANLGQQVKRQKEAIDDCKEDISNLLDIINKNCNELKFTSDEWLVIQKYRDKEVSE